MRHDIHVKGAGFCLRPVVDSDAELILTLRRDPKLNRFLHPTSPIINHQLEWLAAYYERLGDYYFIVERSVDGQAEGVIALYDLDDVSLVAEWGRWILRPGSLAAVESAALIYRCAFDHLALTAVYCRTVADNTSVVAFHDSCGCAERHVLLDYFELGGRVFDAIEHQVDRSNWCEAVGPHLERLAARIATRNLHA